jgi:hypothetical protein
MTATGGAAYAAACVIAGTVAKKTLAGLAGVLPKVGANRDVEIVIANGGVNTVQAYTDALDVFLGGLAGYNKIAIRATGTNTTAGCTAFDGSTADVTYQGGITFTGGNVAGYNPVGATTTSLPCQLAGGGAAGLPAEPASPLGWRVRFDAASSLPNQCRPIAQIVGNTITPSNAFSAAPANGDVFYIEQAGVTVPTSVVSYPSSAEGAQDQGTVLKVAGIRSTGEFDIPNGMVVFTFCGCNLLASVGGISTPSSSRLFLHPVLGNVTVGGGLRAEAASALNLGILIQSTLNAFVCASSLIVTALGNGNGWGTGSYAGAGLDWQNTSAPVGIDATVVPQIGSDTALSAPRIVGGTGLRIRNTFGTLGLLTVSGAGGNPAIKIVGHCTVALKQVVSGTTGNNDVGLDLTSSKRSTIILAATPTVTGTLGDVRLAGGQIITWAQALAGVIDSAGNRIQGTGSPGIPSGALKFTGTILGAAGAVFSYLTDAGTGLAANVVVRPGYPTGLRLFTRLKVTSINNTAANAVAVTLYKNGVATTMTVNIPGGSAGYTVVTDAAHPQLFADGDTFDLRLDDAADVAAVVNVSATLDYAL